MNGKQENMSFESLKNLRAKNPAWRLLAAEQGPFAAAFLYQVFLREQRRAVPEEHMVDALVNFLYEQGQHGDMEELTRLAGNYLLSWSDERHRWLRRFYGRHNEVLYDLTADAQKAIEWLENLHHRAFIGTESRLRTVFSLLHEVERETDPDPMHRLAWLKKQRSAIDEEIAALEKNGEVRPSLSPVQIKERFLQAVQTSAGLLADFREVEDNFRSLEHRLMTDVMTWKQGKGELLEEIFAQRDIIRKSEQGQSFEAFWQFLMTGGKQEDFRALADALSKVPKLQKLLQEYPLDKIMREWLQAAAAVEQTVSSLDRQVRRFVDEHTLQEERYIYELIGKIEQKAVACRELPSDFAVPLPASAPEICLPMDRRMFILPKRTRLRSQELVEGVADGPVTALFREHPVDRRLLARHIDTMLKQKTPVTLGEVIRAYPLTQGLGELLSYLVIASRRPGTDVKQDAWQEILYARDGQKIMARCETVVFYRKQGEKNGGNR